MLGVRPEPGVTYLPVHVIELPAPLSAPQGNAAGPCTGSSSSGVGRRIVLGSHGRRHQQSGVDAAAAAATADGPGDGDDLALAAARLRAGHGTCNHTGTAKLQLL